MTKFSISAEDYNEIVRLGKIFAGKTGCREVLKRTHFKSRDEMNCPELTVEASDGYIYGTYHVQFVEYLGDLIDFSYVPNDYKVDKGSDVTFKVDSDQLLISLITAGVRINIPIELDCTPYPDFTRALPSGPDDGNHKTFNAGKVASCLKWFKAAENVASWHASPDCVYFANRKRAACSVGVKMRERLSEVLLDFTHRRA